MIAGIELGKKYAQISVQTEQMREPESVTLIAGTEQYRIPVEGDLQKKEQLKDHFRKLWKMIMPYGDKEALEYLVFCLEEFKEEMRENLLEITAEYGISSDQVKFTDKKECFCAYVLHQGAELLFRNALLIENKEGNKEKYLLHKHGGTSPEIVRVYHISEKPLDQIFKSHGISSVFLVGDDFEEEWMQDHLKILKTGRRVFAGKNLFVKGACYQGMDYKEGKETYLYLGGERFGCDIRLRTKKNGEEEWLPIVKAGQNWYESGSSMEVILMEEPVLEFEIMPFEGGEQKIVEIPLKDLPERPKKTTRLQIEFAFLSAFRGMVRVKDLGFGELFPASDMSYEGELQWEQ